MKSYVMSSAFILATFVTMNQSQAQTEADRFKNAVFSGTMNSNLPSIQTQNAPPVINFQKSSTISFASTLYCGDGDVAAFQASHNYINFYGQDQSTKGKLVLGYWAVKETPSSIKGATPPTQATWFSVGAADLANDGNSISMLDSSNRSGTSANAYDLLTNALKTVAAVSDSATWVSGRSTYSVYAAAMICPKFETADGAKSDAAAGSNGETNGAAAEQIMNQVIVGAMNPNALAANAVGSVGSQWATSNPKDSSAVAKFFNKHLATIGVDTPAAAATLGMVVSFGKGADGTKVTVDSAAMGAASNLAQSAFNYITGTGQDGQYNALASALNKIAAGSSCTLGPISGHSFQTVAQYEFEPFPVKSTCGMAMNLAKLGAASVYSGLSAASGSCQTDPKTGALSNPTACDAGRIQLARSVTVAVTAPLIMQAAAEELNKRILAKSVKINKASCLPTSNLGSLNDVAKVVGSVHIPLIPTAAGSKILQLKDPGAMVHPEPNFALTQYTLYEKAAGDNRTIFNPAYNDSPKADATASSGLILSFGTNNNYSFKSPGVNVQFHARAIGCPGPAYCAVPAPSKNDKILDPI